MGHLFGRNADMPIKIYTYADPYHIDDESFWDDIKNCPQFCVSQTMVNGLNMTYEHYKSSHQLCTIRALVDAMYDNWNSLNTKVKQMMAVDKAITELENIRGSCDQFRAMHFNAKILSECIRIFCELGLDAQAFKADYLNIDQRFLIEIYKQIQANQNDAFLFRRVKSLKAVDDALTKVLRLNGATDINSLDMNTIVIHGVHQFSPAMLCAIEDIGRFKTVVLMFNYQRQYSRIYETWLNIYSLFNSSIHFGAVDNEFQPTSLYDSFSSNALADSIGKLSEGQFDHDFFDVLKDIEVIEFENTTEFANYVAEIYETARSESETSGIPSPLACMKEQFYSASRKANDILRAYFPEQFGERHFLDYPIGHFFVATTNLWNADEEKVFVNNFADLKECLEAGIISEQYPGQLVNCLNKVIPYIENCVNLNDIIHALKGLTKYANRQDPIMQRIGYFNVEKDDLLSLVTALQELETIITSFFTDFNSGGDNFKRFYARVQRFISSNVDVGELDEEMRGVITNLLHRLDESNLPEEGTFYLLKQTMSIYLSQDDSVLSGAHWIVRGFEQIDGDILRSNQTGRQAIYHFCSLSDMDICASREQRLPWPLDARFFEYSQIPSDWKYQIFVKSKLEYNNFNRYALLYGLEFNRMPCKLSYIKNDGRKENELYHILKLLGIGVKKYIAYTDSSYQEKIKYEKNPEKQLQLINGLQEVDYIKASICPYRFALDSIIQGKTVFRDRFLLQQYMRVLIEKKTLEALADNNFNEVMLREKILDFFNQMQDKFKIADELEKTQLINSVFISMRKKVTKQERFWTITPQTRRCLNLAQDFLFTSSNELQPLSKDKVIELFERQEFSGNHGKHCKYCSCKDICLEFHYFEE